LCLWAGKTHTRHLPLLPDALLVFTAWTAWRRPEGRGRGARFNVWDLRAKAVFALYARSGTPASGSRLYERVVEGRQWKPMARGELQVGGVVG